MARVEVVGGGVAGLSAAWELMDRGAEVRLWEEDRDPARFDACGEAWTEPWLCPLPKDAAHGFAGRLRGFQLHAWPAPGEHHAARFPVREAYMSYRGEVQRAWTEQLAKRGADVRLGARVRDLDALGEGAALVVDASGWPGLAAQRFGSLRGYRRPLLAFYANLPLDDPRFPAGWLHAVGPSHFAAFSGYTWVFPRPDGIANVGVGWDPLDPGRPRRPQDALRATEDLLGLGPTPWAAGNLPLWEGVAPGHALHRLPSGTPVAGVGDAIGAVGPLTGDGLGPAMETARLLAEAWGAGALETYPGRVARHFAGRDRAHWRLRALWDGVRDLRLFAALVRALDGLPFEALDRDPWAPAARLARRPALALRFLAARPWRAGGWAR